MTVLEDSALPTQTVALLLMGFAVIAAVVGALWWIQQRAVRRERLAADALNAVMSATVLRRNVNESLGLVLIHTAEKLHASGTIHLLDEDHQCLRLVESVGVEHLDWVNEVSLTEALPASGNVALLPLDPVSPWAALSPRDDIGSLVVGRVSAPRAKRQGWITLCWRERGQAEASLNTLRNICWYTQNMLAEFEAIEERAAEFQQVADALHRQEVLTRTAAHDLAQQLGASLGYISMLREEAILSRESQGLVDRAVQQLTLMRPLVDDLQDPQRRPELGRVPVERLIELLSGLMALRSDAGVTFRLEVSSDLPDVWCERIAVMRVFYNLLGNALRHNADVDDLEVWVSARQADRAIEFEVGDSGNGIAPENQAHLFEFGYQVNSTGKTTGHGLGLWSCRRIVEAHGGRIWAESQPRRGVRFYFTLPAAPLPLARRNGRCGVHHGTVAG